MSALASATAASDAPHPKQCPPLTHCERRFVWRGVELDGTRRRGKIVAADAAAARTLLRLGGIVVLALDDRGPAPRPRATKREVTAFTRQLAGLLRAGLPLAQALDLLTQASGQDGIARIAAALGRSIAAGTRFSVALARFPAQFDGLYCQLAAVGEASGSLAAVLARAAEERERTAMQRAKLRAVLAYPLAVLLFAAALASGMLVWVVPTFRHVFESFGAALPAPTRAVIALSNAATHHGGAVFAALGALYLAAAHRVRRSWRLRLAVDRMTLALPLVGGMLRRLAAARWSRALGTLLGTGTPLADALTSLVHVSGNSVFDAATGDIAARLARGERLASAMRSTGCFPASIVEPVAVAEDAGMLDALLLDLATLAEQEVDEAVGMLASLAEPLVVIVLGMLVGGLVVALYLPIIELGNVV